jgi:hypothetical protein
MRRGVYSLGEKARNTAPMPVFSSVWQNAGGMVSVFETPHTSLPKQQQRREINALALVSESLRAILPSRNVRRIFRRDCAVLGPTVRFTAWRQPQVAFENAELLAPV